MARDGQDEKTTKGRGGSPDVVCSQGLRQRFLRGMITHDLVQRGLNFDQAYAVARAIRDEVAGREEVSTAEIRDLILKELESLFGSELNPVLSAPRAPAEALRVITPAGEQPFSRGLLAASIHAAGLDFDRAYRLITNLESDLAAERVNVVSSGDIARRVAELVERLEDAATARRYRLVRQIHRLPRPVVIYVGGASGTGKSTLSLELAPLLRIYRVNATDTIRQVMRILFTPAILPALHSSSFEVAGAEEATPVEDRPGSPDDPEFVRRLIATYEEQATRVCVGVRAVVERAIAENMSIVVEGVHLHPNLVPFPDLDGAIYQVPLILATLNAETHRGRFLARSRDGRRAERYVENFDSIRIIHDHLLQHAESLERPLLDTSDGHPPVSESLRIVTGLLENRLPNLDETGPLDESSSPALMIIIDGLGDRPVRALGGRTPLQAARTPTFDRLAMEGSSGLADPIAPGVVPDTASGTLALLGQSPSALQRGAVEALGAGIELKEGDVALRGNLATLDEQGRVVDRRAGRIRVEAGELAGAIDRLPLPGPLGEGVEVHVAAGTEHRLAIVLRGPGLSHAIQCSDPGDGASASEPLTPRPDDPNNEAATRTADLLASFEQEARRVLSEHPANAKRRERGELPANAILTRGPGRPHRVPPLEEAGRPLRLCCIGGDRTILGLASWVGGSTVQTEAMTGNLDTNVRAKFDAAATALKRRDLVVVHLKGADIASHDGRPDLKVEFLEKIDKELGRMLGKRSKPLRVTIAADHATHSESGQHAADPVPVLIWGDGIPADKVETYDEQAAAAGALQRFPLQMLLSKLFRLT